MPYAVRLNKKSEIVQVDCVPFDEFCESEKVQEIDVLKLDTEGLYFLVVKGASRMIAKRAVKFVFVEYNVVSGTDNSL